MFVPHKRSSSSSSSSDSSSDYLFQVDALKATHSRELNDNIHTDTRSALRKYQNDAPSCDRVAISEEADHRYPGLPSTSQVSDVTDEQMVHEWSAASNESLFSLHIGHNMSFTRDHVLMLGEFGKSGELTESGELMFSPAPAVSLGDTDTARKSVEIKVPEATEGTDEPFKKEATVSEDQTEIKRPPPAVTWNSFKTSNHSDGSGTSGNSFAFPVLTEEERIASVKEDGEHQSAKTSSSTACHWFSWFSCCKWGSCRCCRWHKHCCC
ncbi:RNA-binding protein with serine-rich domain like [Quillaja saponaria]|uniref:RNA-binding protein with serine-rich domain like n=1 Tax=Quillaja saponaria TaxID=32244 RepID=A0AAD7L9G8_QUISA|nr:RNA-binding protein with serine-rich domain like [Quillaja saponaria]